MREAKSRPGERLTSAQPIHPSNFNAKNNDSPPFPEETQFGTIKRDEALYEAGKAQDLYNTLSDNRSPTVNIQSNQNSSKYIAKRPQALTGIAAQAAEHKVTNYSTKISQNGGDPGYDSNHANAMPYLGPRTPKTPTKTLKEPESHPQKQKSASPSPQDPITNPSGTKNNNIQNKELTNPPSPIQANKVNHNEEMRKFMDRNAGYLNIENQTTKSREHVISETINKKLVQDVQVSFVNSIRDINAFTVSNQQPDQYQYERGGTLFESQVSKQQT